MTVTVKEIDERGRRGAVLVFAQCRWLIHTLDERCNRASTMKGSQQHVLQVQDCIFACLFLIDMLYERFGLHSQNPYNQCETVAY
jgi:hypothetical protein